MWTDAFRQRVLFNASKAYVSRAEVDAHYSGLQPVYSLNLVNEVFEKDVPEYRHDYSIVHDRYSKKVIEGLHFTFIELPKFTPHTMTEKRMTVLWLRFLTEINAMTEDVPEELLGNPEICRPLEVLEVSAFSDAELLAYDKFWDAVSTERTLLSGSFAEGMEKGKAESKNDIARNLIALGIPVETIMQVTELSEKEVQALATISGKI